jgi:hypothetical protein
MIDHKQWRTNIIKPALDIVFGYSADSEETLIATLAQESLGCSFLVQVGGPAVGPYMVEPLTYKTVLAFINRQPDYRNRVYKAFGYVMPPPIDVLTYNLRFATIIAYCYYKDRNPTFPPAGDLDAIWDYYKMYYNTINGAATKEAFVSNYHRFIGVKDNGTQETQSGTKERTQKGNGKKGT